jgi:hypothetical protein
MNIPIILEMIRPGEEWILNGDTYKGLIWLSNTSKPTEKEITDNQDQAMTLKEAKQQAEQDARTSAIAHAKSLGFTEDMIAVMYPNLRSESPIAP